MGTVSDKLLYLQGTKSAIKDAIVAKGVSVETGTPFRDYATKIGEISGGGGSETADEWVRPTEWLPLPDNIDGVEKVSILNAVFDTDSEFVAFTCRGAYTVDWGDGVVENFADNVKAEHKYTYSDVDLNSDTVATFGYKQCIITITPQAGSNLTAIGFNTFHSSIGSSSTYDITSGFLDMRVNAPLCMNLELGASSSYVKHTMLEQCLIGELADTSLNQLFYDCYSLQSVTIKDTSNVTSFTDMHYNNYSLQKMPTYTFKGTGVDIGNMFNSCYSLRETYPLVITLASNNSMLDMFYDCKSLRYIDLTINSNRDYSLSGTFRGCTILADIKFTQTGIGKVSNLQNTFQSTKIKESPIMDTSICVSFSGTFQYCTRLTDLYEYNYTSATTLNNMLNGCHSLKSVPNFNITNKCTILASLCYNCWSLEKAPTFSDSSGVTSAISMLQYCKSITTIPSYVFGNIIGNFNSPFVYMDSLQSIPNIICGSVYTGNSNFIANCYSLKRMLMPLRFTFSVANAKMSVNALNEMFNILPAVTGQTVTITGNYGVVNTPVISRSGTSAANYVVTMSNTEGLSIGMYIYGAGTMTTEGASVKIDATPNTFSNTAIAFIDGDILSFSNVGATTGITAKTIYYVVNANASTFQIASVANGAAVEFSGTGTVWIVSPSFITEIVPNVSITLSRRQTPFETRTYTFRSNEIKLYLATMKGWTVLA